MHLTDVTLRDGLQSEKITLTTDQKWNLFEKLIDCGFDRIELTSFAHPKWIPQLADAEALCEKVFASPLSKRCELMAFVPNEKGFERLIKFPFAWASAFVSVSRSFNLKNVNSDRQQSLENLQRTVLRARAEKKKIRVYISTVFGCPYEGNISADEVEKVVRHVTTFQPDEIALGDTIGVATPAQVREVLSRLKPIWPVEKTALHLHNTYGMALAGVDTGYRAGVRAFDGAVGGVGGCPYAKGASGNVAIEEMAYLGWRQHWLKAFPAEGFHKVLETLRATGLSTRSQLAQVAERGGTWFQT
jgi:hydroxymethylglutaryl-CoA lyase